MHTPQESIVHIQKQHQTSDNVFWARMFLITMIIVYKFIFLNLQYFTNKHRECVFILTHLNILYFIPPTFWKWLMYRKHLCFHIKHRDLISNTDIYLTKQAHLRHSSIHNAYIHLKPILSMLLNVNLHLRLAVLLNQSEVFAWFFWRGAHSIGCVS